MKKFLIVQHRNTYPIIIYLLTSIIVLFIYHNKWMYIIYCLYLISSYILIKKVIPLILSVSLVFLSYLSVFLIKISSNDVFDCESAFLISLAISMFLSSGLILFWILPTYQHVRLSALVPAKNAPFALLSALRIFDVIRNSSDQIIMAQKVRGFKRSNINLYSTYFSNILVFFLENLYYHNCNVSLRDNIKIDKKIEFSFLLAIESLKLILCGILMFY